MKKIKKFQRRKVGREEGHARVVAVVCEVDEKEGRRRLHSTAINASKQRKNGRQQREKGDNLPLVVASNNEKRAKK